MQHIDCVKKWPAAYAVMAAIMDDVAAGDGEAPRKWGQHAVQYAMDNFNGPVSAFGIQVMFESIMAHMGLDVGHQGNAGVAPKQDDAATKTAPEPKVGPDPSVPSPNQYRPARKATASGKPRAHTRITAKVIGITAVPKAPQYGGGHRHVMTLEYGRHPDGIEGTIPSDLVGNVDVGDTVDFEAKVWEFDHRKGWFKYPRGAKVVSRA